MRYSALGLVIGDFRLGSAVYGLANNGGIQSPADLHGGTAYASADGDAGTFRFGFETPVNVVGAFVSSFKGQPTEDSQPMPLSIFDLSGNLIESDVFTSLPPPPLRNHDFIGVGSTTLIGSFAISSPVPFFVFDDVPRQPGPEALRSRATGWLALGSGRR